VPAPGTPAGGPADAAAAGAPLERPEERTVELKNKLFRATISTRGAALKSFRLADYKERDEAKAYSQLGPEDLVSTRDEVTLPLRLRFREETTTFKLSNYTDWELVSADAEKAVLRYADPKDLSVPVITKTIRVQPDSYQFELEVELENRSESSVTEQPILDLFANYAPPVQSGCMGAPSVPRSPMCMRGEELIPSSSGCSTAQLAPGESRSAEPDIFWTAINEQYFLFAAVPVGVDQAVCRLEAGANDLLISSLMYPEQVIAPGARSRHLFKIYAGPKQMQLMEQVVGGPADGKRNAKLTASVDYGWFSVLCHPMLWLLKNFYSFMGNYGLAIILLTIVIKILLLPLTHKSMKSMAEMAKLKPLMEDLKKRFGADKQRLNQEMMNLYKTHKINPMGGCFPMLLQMPIWIALYRMLYSSVELYQAPFISGWLSDLSYRDPYFILPVVLGGTMFVQQWLSPTSADSQQAKMMLYIMPAFFTFIMLYLPSGLVLYIFVNSLLSIGHQLYYNKRQNRSLVEAKPAGP
jgi:YidC/Oxa1 family membrane protein insertase